MPASASRLLSHPRTPRIADLLAILLILSVSIYSAVFYFGADPTAFVENGPVENLQLALLCVALAVFAPLLRRWRGTPLMAECAFLALVTFAVTIREIDVRGTAFEPALGAFFAHKGQWLVLAAAWLFYVIRFWRQRGPAFRALLAWIRTPAGMMFLAAMLIYALVHLRFIDRRHEETGESFAVLMILIAALRLWSGRDLPPRPSLSR